MTPQAVQTILDEAQTAHAEGATNGYLFKVYAGRNVFHVNPLAVQHGALRCEGEQGDEWIDCAAIVAIREVDPHKLNRHTTVGI